MTAVRNVLRLSCVVHQFRKMEFLPIPHLLRAGGAKHFCGCFRLRRAHQVSLVVTVSRIRSTGGGKRMAFAAPDFRPIMRRLQVEAFHAADVLLVRDGDDFGLGDMHPRERVAPEAFFERDTSPVFAVQVARRFVGARPMA